MCVVAVAMVRDEADIVARTVGHMASQVDRVLISDNGSIDGTRELLEQMPRVTVVDDPEPGYYQSKKITALAQQARDELGAHWIVPFDADEMWFARTHMPFRAALMNLPGHVLIAEAALYDHVASGLDPQDPDPIERLQWRRPYPAPLPKVACRAREDLVIGQGNHTASYEETDLPPAVTNLLTIRHFPYRSTEQLVRKVRNGAAAYRATDLPDEFGAHWRTWGRMLDEQGPAAIADLFRTWYWRRNPAVGITIEGERQPPLVHDPCPA